MKILLLNGTAPTPVLIFPELMSKLIHHDTSYQHGLSRALPLANRNFDFIPRARLLSSISNYDVIISNAGIGSILDLRGFARKTILVPRRLKNNDTKSDQLKAALFFATEYGFNVSQDVDEVMQAIECISTQKLELESYKSTGLTQVIIKQFIKYESL